MSVDESEYICDYCSRSFTRKYNLLTHIENCHINQSCYCSICEQRFGSPAGLQCHLTQGHNRYGEGLPECDICGRIFTRKQNIISHMITIHLQVHKKIKCNICFKFFTSERNLKRHIQQIHNSTFDYLTCDECNKLFTGKHSLILHIQSVHTKKVPKCDVCGKYFMNARNLRRHIETHNQEKLEYKCDFCPKAYSMSQSLRRHIHSLHDDKSKIYNCNYFNKLINNNLQNCTPHKNKKHFDYYADLIKLNLICDTCNVSFKDEHILRQHIKDYHGFQEFYKYCKKTLVMKSIGKYPLSNRNKQISFNCKFCPKVFTTVFDLKSHMKLHYCIGHSYSKCYVCYKEFLNKESEISHKKTCILPVNVNSCNHCNKLFTIISSLEFHMKIFHPQIQIVTSNMSNTDVKPYNRSEASFEHIKQNLIMDEQLQKVIYKKVFNKKIYLDTHICNKLLNKCPYCRKEFKSKENMKQHIESAHLWKQTYECVECMHIFKEKSSLQKHIRTKHVNYTLSFIGQDINEYKCMICNSIFKDKYFYEKHKKIHSKVTQTPHCIICAKHFSSRKTLKRHIKKFHTEFKFDELADYGTIKQDFTVQCENCIKNFIDDYHFGIYQKCKDISSSVIFKCEFCKNSYSCIEYLIQRCKQKFNNPNTKLYLSELCTTEISDTESQIGPN